MNSGRGAEGTKNRNRKSPRFSVADVPVANQTAVGTRFFSSEKIAQRIAIASDFPSQGRIARLSGGKGSFSFEKSLQLFQSQSRKNPHTWCTQVRGGFVNASFFRIQVISPY